MVVDRNGLPQDRAAEEGAQERIQWLHPRDGDHQSNDESRLICTEASLQDNFIYLLSRLWKPISPGALDSQLT